MRGLIVKLIPTGKSGSRNTLLAVPARLGAHPWAAGFRRRACAHVYMYKTGVDPADW